MSFSLNGRKHSNTRLHTLWIKEKFIFYFLQIEKTFSVSGPNTNIIFKYHNKNKQNWQNFLCANWPSKIPRTQDFGCHCKLCSQITNSKSKGSNSWTWQSYRCPMKAANTHIPFQTVSTIFWQKISSINYNGQRPTLSSLSSECYFYFWRLLNVVF